MSGAVVGMRDPMLDEMDRASLARQVEPADEIAFDPAALDLPPASAFDVVQFVQDMRDRWGTALLLRHVHRVRHREWKAEQARTAAIVRRFIQRQPVKA